MPKFLDTAGVTYHLQHVINNANEKLILISPYLKINDRIKSSLVDKDKFKIDIRLIYGKSELQPAEHNWLKSLQYVHTSFCKNLHAKCYLNEKEAIVTSMNLYDFSQVNNYEMGIYVEKDKDTDLYNDIYQEVNRLIRASDESKVTVSTIPSVPKVSLKPTESNDGYCIRCHSEIKLDPMTPYCRSCYNLWKKFRNEEFQEKYCHICGRANKSTLLKPACLSCYKAKSKVLEFPTA
ncbi:MAG: phospholipase D-like domain-containing protein [Dehalococcoidales bacterium]